MVKKKISSLATVLSVLPHGESDKVVSLYSKENGKIHAIAKGAFRSKKRFVNKLELFTTLNLLLSSASNGTLFFLHESELIKARVKLRHSYPKFVLATYILELLNKFCTHEEPDQEIYTLLNWALDNLELRENCLFTLVAFQFRLLNLCGYQPEIIPTAPNHYSGKGYNNVIIKDKHQQNHTLNLSPQLLTFLSSVDKIPLNRLHLLHLNKPQLHHILVLLNKYSSSIIQQDFNSWDQVNKICQV